MSEVARPAEPILHVDMDAFYASVEAREDPSLAGFPVAVGGGGPRGVVMSASYEARAFGVRSAMPGVRARRLCPDLVFVHPNMALYREESDRVLGILSSFTPIVEQVSLDEAFLDVGGSVRLFGAPARIAEQIRSRVRIERGLVCSVGVAPNKLLAKLASADAKPDGIRVVPANGVRAFLDPLPVRRLWGVGPETAAALDRLGVRTVAELSALPAGVLERAFGPGPGAALAALAAGRDDRTVTVHQPAKHISAEQTFERDLDAPEQIRTELLRLSDRVAARLRAGAIRSRTITVKIRLSNFQTTTRSRTLPAATDVSATIYRTAVELFEGVRLVRPRVRLLGVAAGGLTDRPAADQLRLGEEPDRWPDADRAVDRVRARFGNDAVDRAAAHEHRPRPPVPPRGAPRQPGSANGKRRKR